MIYKTSDMSLNLSVPQNTIYTINIVLLILLMLFLWFITRTKSTNTYKWFEFWA